MSKARVAPSADGLLSSDIPALERLIGGFRQGWLYALCAAENASAVPLALTLAHRLAVQREVPVAYVCADAEREWLLREIAWEDVEVSSPYHYRGERSADEERQIAERREANQTRPLHLLSREGIPPGALEGALLALPRRPRLVIVPAELHRQDTAPAALRRLASVLHVPVLLLCSLEPMQDDRPRLADVPEAVARSADVLLAVGNPLFTEEQEEEAIPDHFHTLLTLLAGEPPPTELLRFDLTTHRYATED